MSWTPLEQWLVAEHASARSDSHHSAALTAELSPAPAELRTRALQLAAGLQRHGIRRALLQFDDAVDLAVALLACWQAGTTAILAAEGQQPSAAQLGDARSGHHGTAPGALVVLGTAAVPSDNLSNSLTATPIAALLEPALAPTPLAGDAELLLCTSGSSGQPKLIAKRLHQLSAEIANLQRLWGNDLDAAVVIGSVAAHHIYGLLYRVLWPLAAGQRFLRTARPFPAEIQHLSQLCERAIWVASPALLKRLGEPFDWTSLRGVRRIFSSGGALPADVAASIHRNSGQWAVEVYGSSETGGIGWRQGKQPWRPFPGIELGCDGRGALQIVSPYLPDQQPFTTDDAATLHDDGSFELGARLDRIVKLEDKRVSLPQIEQRLAAHPWVNEARLAVLQESRAYLGALVALRPAGIRALRGQGRRAVTETLRYWLKAHTETLALPRRWRLLHELPLTPQGKLPLATIESLLRAPRSREPERLQVEQHPDQWQIQLRVPLDLAHFSGHFPTSPVLPGVVQIGWALNIARELMPDLPGGFGGMEVLKFHRLARPGDELALGLRWDAARGKLYFVYQLDSETCSSGRILLGATDG